MILDRFSAEKPTDTVVMSHYPLGGNIHNTGPRYREEAALTGFDVVGISRSGTNTLHPSTRLRSRLSPEHFDEFCAESAEDLDAVAQDYDTVIWRGQSTGSFPTLSIVKNRLAKATHLLLEDGINLRQAPGNRPVTSIQGRVDWWSYDKDERAGMPRPPEAGWELPKGEPQGKIGTAAKFLVEQFHWAPLWRSLYSREATLDIAREQWQLPMFVKFVGHSATATEAEIGWMTEELGDISATRKHSQEPAAEIKIGYDASAWHGYLLYPQFGAQNLSETAQLQSFVSSD